MERKIDDGKLSFANLKSKITALFGRCPLDEPACIDQAPSYASYLAIVFVDSKQNIDSCQHSVTLASKLLLDT